MNDARQLVKMANQIAANLQFHPDTAERLADHLQRFWAPSMRRILFEHAQAGEDDLEPVVREVICAMEQAE